MSAFNSPAETAEVALGIAEVKAKNSFKNLAILGILAGVYIAFGAQLSNMVTFDLAKYLGAGFSRFIAGSVFSVGLMLVVIGGAELFTGNTLMFQGLMAGKIGTGGMLRNWVIVYFANFAGSLLLVWLMYSTGLWKTSDGLVGAKAVMTASAKVDLTWGEAFARGILCNWLVVLAVWLAIAGRDVVSKIFGIFFPIMAFVASGFEHSIANMYFIPMGIALKNDPKVLGSLATLVNGDVAAKVANLTWGNFIVKNLIPVTLGNIVGGALFVGGLYWMTYVAKRGVAAKKGVAASGR